VNAVTRGDEVRAISLRRGDTRLARAARRRRRRLQHAAPL